MTRSLPAGFGTEIATDTIRYALLLELNLDGGDVNMWSGAGDLSWNSKSWSGLGDLGSISAVKESADFNDDRVKVALSLADGGDLLDIDGEFNNSDPVGRGFTLYLALLDADATINSVLTLTSGFIDGAVMTDGPLASVEVILAAESVLYNREMFFRMDDQHQRQLFVSDAGLEFVTDLSDEIVWGAASAKTLPAGSGGDGGEGSNNMRSLR